MPQSPESSAAANNPRCGLRRWQSHIGSDCRASHLPRAAERNQPPSRHHVSRRKRHLEGGQAVHERRPLRHGRHLHHPAPRHRQGSSRALRGSSSGIPRATHASPRRRDASPPRANTDARVSTRPPASSRARRRPRHRRSRTRRQRLTLPRPSVRSPLVAQVRLQLGSTGGPFAVAGGIIKNEGFGALYTVRVPSPPHHSPQTTPRPCPPRSRSRSSR